MTHIVHTADTHLGYAQYHKDEREEDFADAFHQVIDGAVEQDVDAVVHAGDVFEDSRPKSDAMDTFVTGLTKLKSAGIPFLMVVGNHEGTSGSQWADIFEKIGLGERLGDEPVVIEDTAFYGLDHVPKTRRKNLNYQFTEPSEDVDYTALVAHGQFAPMTAGTWDTTTVLSESNIDFDALLLGDEHKRIVTEINDTLVTYPGSSERTASDQRATRAYNTLRFGETDHDGTAPVAVTRNHLDTRTFNYINTELGEDDSMSAVTEEIDNHDVEDSVLIIRLTGDGQNIRPADIETHGKERGAFVVRVYDDRDFDEESIAEEIDFADPASAAEERIGNMDLSKISEDLDDRVRGGGDDIPITNLRESSKELIGSRVEEGTEVFPSPEDESAVENQSDSGENDGSGEDSANRGADGTESQDSDGVETSDSSSPVSDQDGQVGLTDY